MNMTTTFDDIAAKLEANAELTAADARALTGTSDIITLGSLADRLRRRLHGDRVTFCRVADVTLDESGAAAPEIPGAAGEIRILGIPDSLDRAMDFVASVAARAGGRRVSAFSLADLAAYAADRGVPLDALLGRLKRAGVDAIAEAPVNVVEVSHCEAVAASGLQVARLTVTTASLDDCQVLFTRVPALAAALADRPPFQPLPRGLSGEPPSTGYDDVKAVALARLLARGISSIQVDWALYGPKLAQVALTFGADDIDAVSPLDGAELGARRATIEEVRRNIRAASFRPVERDGRFQVSEG